MALWKDSTAPTKEAPLPPPPMTPPPSPAAAAEPVHKREPEAVMDIAPKAPQRVTSRELKESVVAPEITIASVVINLPHAFLTVAREVRAHTFKPRVIRLGTESDVVTLVINPAFRPRIPPATLHVVDSVRTELAAQRFDPLGAAR